MFKKIILIPCLCYTMTLSKEISSSQIDPTKRGVALGTFLSDKRAKKVLTQLPEFDIYIKETTTTKKPFFVPFALNISSDSLKSKLNKIKKKIPSAYVTSNSRVKQLSKESILVSKKLDNKKNEKIETLNSNEDLVLDAIVNKEVEQSKNKIIDRKNLDVDTTLKAITVGKFSTLSEAVKNASKLKEYDVLVKAPIITGNDFTLYVVNIEKEEFDFVFDEVSSFFGNIEESSQTRIDFIYNRYINGDKFIFKTLVETKSQDSSVYILNLISKLQNDKKSSFQLKYNQAKKLYDQGEYRKAIDAFGKLSEEKSDNIPINFYLARAYYKIGEYEQASAVFERVLIIDENHQRARLELALTYEKLKLNDEAIKEFKAVLKDKTIPKNVVENIKKRIAYIEAKRKKHFLYGSLALGITNDDNVHNISTNDTIYYNGTKQTDISQGDIISDTYYSVNLNANYLYKINDNYSIENKVGYLHQIYSKDDQRNDDSNSRLTIAGKEKQELQIANYGLYLNKYSNSSVLSTGLDFSKVDQGKKDYSKSVGATISLQSKMFKNTRNLAILKVYRKNYTKKDPLTNKKELLNLDSNNIQLILGNNIPTDKFGVFTLLYSHLREDRLDNQKDPNAKKAADKSTDTLIFSNRYPINQKLYINSSLMFSREKGRGVDTASLFEREDELYVYSLEALYKINNDISISTEIKYNTKDSNMDEYDYKKRTYGLNLKYFF